MDNELEIVSNDMNAIPAEVGGKPNPIKTAMPVVGGVAGGIMVGLLLYRYVVVPLIRKHKAKKEAAAAEEPKSEE